MKKALLIVATLVVGILLGSLLMGTVLAAPPSPQASPTPGVPGTGYGRGGMMGRGGMSGMMGNMMAGEMGIEEGVLTLLQTTREQVIAERQAGKSLLQIAQAKGVSEQQLVSTILAAKRADLDKLVADGKLTQAQSDQMYQNMQQTVPQAIKRTTASPMQGNGNAQPGDCPMWDSDDQTPGNAQPGRGGMRGGRWNGPSS